MKDNKDYTRRNRVNGETDELTPEECKKHDDIFYYEALATLEDKVEQTREEKIAIAKRLLQEQASIN